MVPTLAYGGGEDGTADGNGPLTTETSNKSPVLLLSTRKLCAGSAEIALTLACLWLQPRDTTAISELEKLQTNK